MNKLYELIIGEDVARHSDPIEATETSEAVPGKDWVEHVDRVDLKTVSAIDAEAAIEKLKPSLTPTQHIESVSKLSNIDVA